MTQYIGGVQEIMVREMKRVLPDINVKTDPCLMDRWIKVDGEHDRDGNLLVITEEYLATKNKGA